MFEAEEQNCFFFLLPLPSSTLFLLFPVVLEVSKHKKGERLWEKRGVGWSKKGGPFSSFRQISLIHHSIIVIWRSVGVTKSKKQNKKNQSNLPPSQHFFYVHSVSEHYFLKKGAHTKTSRERGMSSDWINTLPELTHTHTHRDRHDKHPRTPKFFMASLSLSFSPFSCF